MVPWFAPAKPDWGEVWLDVEVSRDGRAEGATLAQTYHPVRTSASHLFCVKRSSRDLIQLLGSACVIVPVCTENWLRFSARLDHSTPEVRFVRAVAG
jgi:hypothetical protein